MLTSLAAPRSAGSEKSRRCFWALLCGGVLVPEPDFFGHRKNEMRVFVGDL